MGARSLAECTPRNSPTDPLKNVRPEVHSHASAIGTYSLGRVLQIVRGRMTMDELTAAGPFAGRFTRAERRNG